MADNNDRGKMTVGEAGKKGGEKRAQQLGHQGYVQLGQKGGKATARTHGPDFYSEIGQKGGRSRANDSGSKSEEMGQMSGRSSS